LLHALVRIKRNYTVEQAQSDVNVIAERIASAYPAEEKDVVFGVFPLLDQVVGRYRAALWSLFGGAVIFLLIVCASAAHLLLARGMRRGQEMSIRITFGATRSGLMRQLLTENLLLGIGGGIGGVVFAYVGGRLLVRTGLTDIPRFGDARVDSSTMVFACVVSLLTVVLFGGLPAIRTPRSDIVQSLKQGGVAYSYWTRGYLRDVTIVSQVAFAFMLMAGSGLLINSFIRLLRVDWGFRTDHILIMRVRLPRSIWRNVPLQNNFAEQAYRDLERLPGVAVTGMGGGVPFRTTWRMRHVKLDGHASVFTQEWMVGPGFFEALGIPLLRGRGSTRGDGSLAPKGAIVSSSLDDELWPGRNPIGDHLDLMMARKPVGDVPHRITESDRTLQDLKLFDLQDPKLFDSISYEVVGVAKEVRMFGLKPVDSMPSIYIDYRQRPDDDSFLAFETFILRTAGDPMGLESEARSVIQDLNREVGIEVTAMSQLVSEATGGRGSTKLLLVVSSSTSILSLLLASLGIYSVLSYTTGERKHEIGVRLALGAQRNHIFRLIIERSMFVVAVGVLIWLAGAEAANRMLSSYLYGVAPTDPGTLIVAVVFFLAVAFLACYGPARRARNVDPMIMLRYE
jgi:putative ABC transport system permease protein